MVVVDAGDGRWWWSVALRTLQICERLHSHTNFNHPSSQPSSATSHPSAQPSSVYTYPHARPTSASTPGLANVRPLAGKFPFSHLCGVSTHAHPSVCVTSICMHAHPRARPRPSPSPIRVHAHPPCHLQVNFLFSFIPIHSIRVHAHLHADPPFASTPIRR